MPSANPSRGPSPPPGSISADQAIAAALNSAPGAGRTATALWAHVDVYPFGTPGELAWWVRLQGLAAPACPGAEARVPPAAPVGAPGSPCLDMEGGVDAVVDPASGALLGWGY